MKGIPEVWTVPGSLLLAGEYRITEDGGKGFSVAAGGRALLNSLPAEKLSVRGIYPGVEEFWSEEKKNDGSLAGAVYSQASADPDSSLCRKKTITLDTSPFFGADGSKLGYGSSAAGALLLCGAMISRNYSSEIPRLAVEAHRIFQNGRGSGYDVITSYQGKCGIFEGGRRPSRTGLDWPWDFQIWIVKAQKPVRTVQAVSAYEKWKKAHQREWREFTDKSDTLVGNLSAAVRSADNARISETSGWPVKSESEQIYFLRNLSEAAETGMELGNAIGISAEPELPPELANLREKSRAGVAVKCLGAGNELTLIAGLQGAISSAEIHYLNQAVGTGIAEVLHVDPVGFQREIKR